MLEGMDQHQSTDAQLAALDVELAGQDFLADYQLSMRGEMGFQGGIIDYLGLKNTGLCKIER